MCFWVELCFITGPISPMRSTSLEVHGGWSRASVFGTSGCIVLESRCCNKQPCISVA